MYLNTIALSIWKYHRITESCRSEKTLKIIESNRKWTAKFTNKSCP